MTKTIFHAMLGKNIVSETNGRITFVLVCLIRDMDL